MKIHGVIAAVVPAIGLLVMSDDAPAQVPPSPAEAAAYTGLHAAAGAGDVNEIHRLAAAGDRIRIETPGGGGWGEPEPSGS